MNPNKNPARRLDLGIKSALSAAKEVAEATNTPSLTYPANKPVAIALAEHPATANNITPLPTSAPAERKVRGPKPAPVRRYSVDLPVYTIEDINEQAYTTKRTKKQVILEALKAGGLKIKDIDIHEETPNA